MSANNAYTFTSPRKQLFSIPFTVISSMLENPSSPNGLMKLYQTCKYFYGKLPILIVDDPIFNQIGGNPEDEAKIWMKGLSKGAFRIVSSLKVPIWVASTIKIPYLFNKRIPTIYRYSIDTIFLDAGKLQFADFLFLSTKNKIKHFLVDKNLHGVLLHPNGDNATIDEVLLHLPDIQEFKYFLDGKCSLEVLTNLNAIKFNNKLNDLELTIRNIHETFDLNLFCEFIQKNCDENTVFLIYYYDQDMEKLKAALARLDPKWKNEAHKELKEWFHQIDPYNY